MTEAEIRQQISIERAALKKLKDRRSKTKNDYYEYNELKKKFVSLKNNFVSKQTARRNSLSNILKKSYPIKAIKKYYFNMNSLLNNSEYNSAVNGLDSAISKANKKIEALNQDLDYLDGQISRKERKIENLKKQLRSVQLEALNSSN